MAGAFSGHMVDSFNHSIVSQGHMSFNPNLHGTQTSTSFSTFGSQGSMTFQEVSEATAVKIAALQFKLNQKLGPEYISQRPGPGGGPKLTYAEGWKIINLANEVFGFNGWSSNVVSLVTDFVDLHEESKRYNIMVTAIVRVTLRDGVFHEDVGSGTIENTKSKGQGLDKCKKEAVTDGLKRALRNFGNLLGNCLYDKSYTQEVVKIKTQAPKFDPGQLHRRPEFEDKKPNIISTPMANQTNSMGPPVSHVSNPHPQSTIGGSAPVGVKQEPITQLPSGINGQAQQPPPKPRLIPPPPPLVQAQRAPNPVQTNVQRRVNFADPNTSASSVPAVLDADNLDESFQGFSDDDAFLASIDLEDLGPPIHNEDSGPPIAEETDLDPPLHYADTNNNSVSVNAPGNPSSGPCARQPTSGRSSRLEAIIAAQMHQQDSSSTSGIRQKDNTTPGPPKMNFGLANQQHGRVSHPSSNENRNPANVQQGNLGVNQQAKHSPTPMGGFHFPPGTTGGSMQTRGPNATSTVGVKRPLEAMASGVGLSRGSRPGMGLQQATVGSSNGEITTANGRQVLGRLDNGDGGDIKRMRR